MMGSTSAPEFIGGSFRMLVVETTAKIRRAYFVQGKSIKAICHGLRVSRKVVRKVLRTGATAFEYERTVQPQPKVGPWKEVLNRLLALGKTKSVPAPAAKLIAVAKVRWTCHIRLW